MWHVLYHCATTNALISRNPEPLQVHVLLLKLEVGPAQLDHLRFPGFQDFGQLRDLLQQPISFGRVAHFRMTRHRRNFGASSEMSWNRFDIFLSIIFLKLKYNLSGPPPKQLVETKSRKTKDATKLKRWSTLEVAWLKNETIRNEEGKIPKSSLGWNNRSRYNWSSSASTIEKDPDWLRKPN